METKPLLYGLIGFFAGGLLVSIAATTWDKPTQSKQNTETSMSQMTESLKGKTGDSYDEAFISYMIEHHESAVDMAKLSGSNAKHQEIKDLSNEIVSAQEKEIAEMKQWRSVWGYKASSGSHQSH